MTTALTIDQILEAKDVQIESVSAWGGTVYVRSITSDKKDWIEQQHAKGDGTIDLVGYRASLVAACLCDENGAFQNPTPIQVKALGNKSVREMEKVIEACRRLNEMGLEEQEELEKNLQESAAGNGSG